MKLTLSLRVWASLVFVLSGVVIGSLPAWGNTQVAPTSALTANIDRFRFELSYSGEQDKPFYKLTLSVAPRPRVGAAEENSFDLFMQIDKEQAKKLVQALGADGDLRGGAADQGGQGYHLTAATTGEGAVEYTAFLGFDLEMLRHMDVLRKAMDGDAAKGMDSLLARLSGLRKQWEKEGRVFDRNGLALLVKSPAPVPFGKAPAFDVSLQNTSGKPMMLAGVSGDVDQWNLQLRNEATGMGYTVSAPPRQQRGQVEPVKLEAGKSTSISISLADCKIWVVPTKFPAKMMEADPLPAGKYTVVFGKEFQRREELAKPKGEGTWWEGEVGTAPVSFEVVAAGKGG